MRSSSVARHELRRSSRVSQLPRPRGGRWLVEIPTVVGLQSWTFVLGQPPRSPAPTASFFLRLPVFPSSGALGEGSEIVISPKPCNSIPSVDVLTIFPPLSRPYLPSSHLFPCHIELKNSTKPLQTLVTFANLGFDSKTPYNPFVVSFSFFESP